MLREEHMLNVDGTEELALFNVNSRDACDAVVVPSMRRIVHAATKALYGERR